MTELTQLVNQGRNGGLEALDLAHEIALPGDKLGDRRSDRRCERGRSDADHGEDRVEQLGREEHGD